jgi:hypothetical protein
MSKVGSLSTPDLGHLSTDLNHTDTRTVPIIASTVLIVLLMMGAESTQNMYSNLAVNNKYDCLKLHHVGYLIK